MSHPWMISGILLLVILGIIYIWLYVLVSQYDDVTIDGQSREIGIVLGAALWDGKPSPPLKERLQVATQLIQQGKVERLILSGGKGSTTISEAEAMKQLLLDQGIPIEKLILEDQSTNTKENLEYSARLIKPHHSKNIYLITHDYHLFRANRYARQVGLHPSPAPAHSTYLWTPLNKSRECIAVIKQFIFH